MNRGLQRRPWATARQVAHSTGRDPLDVLRELEKLSHAGIVEVKQSQTGVRRWRLTRHAHAAIRARAERQTAPA